MKPVLMIPVLREIESLLPSLLNDDTPWQSLDVTYETPRVERVWRDVILNKGSVRVCLHRIHPCEKAFIHPHPWPSAMRVVSGTYEMEIGARHPINWGDYDRVATITLTRGSLYEMTDVLTMHSVRPIGGVAHTLMVMGPKYKNSPFDHSKFGQGQKLQPLEEPVKHEIMEQFFTSYPSGVNSWT